MFVKTSSRVPLLGLACLREGVGVQWDAMRGESGPRAGDFANERVRGQRQSDICQLTVPVDKYHVVHPHNEPSRNGHKALFDIL
jgi:hypothetical protein